MLELTSLRGQEPGGRSMGDPALQSSSTGHLRTQTVAEFGDLVAHFVLLRKADASPDTGKLSPYRAPTAPGAACPPGAHPLPALCMEGFSKEGLKWTSWGSRAPGTCGFVLFRLWACFPAGGLSIRCVAVPLVPPWLHGPR